MTPMLRFALAFAVGLGVGLRTGDPALALLTGAAAAGLAWWGVARREPAALVACVCAAGIGHGALASAAARDDCRARLPDGVTVEATVLLLEPARAGQAVDAFLERLDSPAAAGACVGRVRVRLPAGGMPPDASHAVISGVWWTGGPEGGWPVPPERRGTLAARRVASIDARGHSHGLTRLRLSAVATAARVFDRERALAESMLLARRDDLDDEVRQSFAAAGLAHMLAISGAHVGVLAGVVLLAARVLGAGARLAPALAALGTLLYVAFLGAPAAASRAALQALMLLVSRMMQRPADPLSLMAAVATALLAVRPLSFLDAGFQLSFAGVFGLIAFRQPLGVLFPQRLPRSLRDAAAATLAASIATTPIAAWHFGIVSWIGPIANLVAAPVMALALPASALALAAGAISDPVGSLLGGGAGVLLRGLRIVAEGMARPGWGYSWVTPFGVSAAVAGAAVAFRFAPAPAIRAGLDAVALLRAIRVRHLARFGSAVAVAAVILATASAGRGALEIHAIDVGQGDAIAIRTPAGRWILIDAGPRTATFDAGRQRVLPYLLGRGARRLEALILTHPDADHVGGAQWLWRAFDIRTVLDPAVATGKGMYLDVLAAAREHGTAWLAAREGRELALDGITIRVLAPTDSFLDRTREANDFSVVIRLEYGAFGALFLGDAPTAVENAVVDRFGAAVRSDLIKVGHHGSRTSTGDSLLSVVRPVVALVSVGRRNRYGHPAPDVVRRLEAYGVRILRTDQGGSIEVRVRPGTPLEVRRRR